MGVIESAVNWAVRTANDPSHGYSQTDRWGPDYDCASFVITAYEQAGVPVREAGASYTGNMYGAFLACGFEDVTGQVNRNTGYGVQAGDVLLNQAAHTCLAIGGGMVANCRTDEGHPQSGDQGQEIRVQSYWNFPWNCVLRYEGPNAGGGSEDPGKPDQPTPSDPEPVVDHSLKLPMIRKGSRGAAVYVAQGLLELRRFSVGGIDGDFGPKTDAAARAFQDWAGSEANGTKLEVDGIIGPNTWKKLMEVEK